MSDRTDDVGVGFMAGVIVTLVISIAITVNTTKYIKASHCREAIKAGVATYVVDKNTQEPVFTYITQTNTVEK